ncbi:DUF6281 family protein [Streptomyces sp. CA-100214]
MPIAISSQRAAAVSPRSRQMPWYSRIVVVAAALTAACATQGGGGEAEGSCAMAALYDGRTYTEVDNVRFTVGAALGTAEFPPCDDTPVHDADAAKLEPVTAYAVDGLNPRTTIAIRYPSDELMLLVVQPDGSLPPEVKAPTPA